MTFHFPPLARAAELLGGEVHSDQVLCPGPNHSAVDRSLSVKPSGDAPDGFVVHSFAGDDDLACKDYVRSKLGLERGEREAKGERQERRRRAVEAHPRTRLPPNRRDAASA